MFNIFKAVILSSFLLIMGKVSNGQSPREIAARKGDEAVKLMDNGRLDESITLLEEAQKMDPESFVFPYELAYAYYLKENFKQAIAILEKNKKHKQVNDRLYQLLGNSYDMTGETEKALKAYDEGLKVFPSSGKIYLEKGNVYWIKEEYGKALGYYEKGIEVDPGFPSNYYRATRLYCSSSDEVWGMIYGEIFMNLERNSKRTAEISKLLFDTYKKEIKLTSDTSLSISFCRNVIDVKELTDVKNFKMPFCMVYEPTLAIALGLPKKIDLQSLDGIRTRFLETYYKMGHNKTHPNLLFAYQDKVMKAGHLEAYNHWILMKGDEKDFDKWLDANRDKWETFTTWFSENGLKVDTDNRFFRAQY